MADESVRAARLAAMRDRFIARAHEQRERILVLSPNLSSADDQTAVVTELRHLCHSLHGTAGTFGFPVIGEVAARAEVLCEAVLASGSGPSAAAARDIQSELAEVAGLIDRIE